jgi:2-dehydropantoate 2-reductase
MIKIKIAVIGAGAVGSVVGGFLAEAGEDVTLIGRQAHVNAINQEGLLLEGPSGKRIIRIEASEELSFKPDLALLTVKTQDVEPTITKTQSFLADTTIITFQNGVRSDDIVAGVLGKENIISSVVLFNSLFLEPGKVIYSNPSSKAALLIGEPFDAKKNRLPTCAALLNKALPTTVSKDIRGAHWTKLLWNLNNAVPAITGLSIQESNRYPSIRKLYIDLMKEGFEVLKLAGIKTAPIPGIPLSLIKIMFIIPSPISSFIVKSTTQFLGEVPVLGSTLQSIKRGKSTEIDYLNGEITDIGKKKGIPTPLNTMMVELVHQVEATGKFIAPENLAQKTGI